MIGLIVYCDVYNINTLHTFTIFMTHTNRSVNSNENMCQLSTERVTCYMYFCKMLVVVVMKLYKVLSRLGLSISLSNHRFFR